MKEERRIPHPYLSKAIRSLNLTAQEKADLVEFLKSLTGEIDPALTSLPEMPR